MAALNHERLTPATANTLEELRNGAKNTNTSESTSFWLSVWKTGCEGKSIALEIEEHEPAEMNRLLDKINAEVKNKYDLPALPPREFFHVYIINNCINNKTFEHDWMLAALIYAFILQADKFLKCDWLRPVVFKPNLKYLHVKITIFCLVV